jgi:pyruvate/2-oxoglutarate dehydrogenase complex dihydrolipoamide dehydrogenase (E3) component
VVAANLLHGNHRRPNYAGLASVAFTVPALATVGLTEAAARTQGLRFRSIIKTPRSGLPRARPGRPRGATRS